MKQCTSASILTLPKLTKERSNNCRISTEDILLEEATQLCNVCSCTLAEDNVTCVKCSHLCLASCMNLANSEVCQSCLAAEEQLYQHQNTMDHEQTQNTQTSGRIEPVTCTSTDLTALSTLPAVAGRGAKSMNCSVTAAVVSNKEFRQLEGKLKKWENELKLREAKITDKSNENHRL